MQQLTKEERARIKDGCHQIQSASDSLSRVDSDKIPGLESIENCLEKSDKALRDVLKSSHLKTNS
jgi:hypothetical protein